MKKTTILLLAALTFSAGTACAISAPEVLPIERTVSVLATGEKSQPNPQNSFLWDETPWLYVKFTAPTGPGAPNEMDIYADWYYFSASGGQELRGTAQVETLRQFKSEYWLSLDTLSSKFTSTANWTDPGVREEGIWRIDARYEMSVTFGTEAGDPRYTGSGSTTFSVGANPNSAPPVAPEPVSAALFLAGGIVLATRHLKNKVRNLQ